MPQYTYTCDDGDTKSIRLSAARATAAGFTLSATDDDDSAKVSKTNRAFGLRPRGVRLSRNLGTADEPNMRYSFLPIPTEAAFNGGSFNKGSSVSIGSTSWTVTSKAAENAK